MMAGGLVRWLDGWMFSFDDTFSEVNCVGFFEGLLTAENMIALLTLTGLEIVLGIDNIVFLTIVVEKLPEAKRALGRRVGLLLAMVLRILLLLGVKWLIGLNEALFTILGQGFSIHSLVLIAGGLFLIAKATFEIHSKLAELEALAEVNGKGRAGKKAEGGGSAAAGFWMVIAQVLALDLIFSIDSVITAVGMASHLSVIIIAVVVAVLIMMVFAEVIGRFVSRNPTIKMLALAFLILIGVALVAEGFEVHLPKGYIYSAMGFSLMVELINLKVIRGMFDKKASKHHGISRITSRTNTG